MYEEDDDDYDDKECDCCLSCFIKVQMRTNIFRAVYLIISLHRQFFHFLFWCENRIPADSLLLSYIDECNFCERKMVRYVHKSIDWIVSVSNHGKVCIRNLTIFLSFTERRTQRIRKRKNEKECERNAMKLDFVTLLNSTEFTFN